MKGWNNAGSNHKGTMTGRPHARAKDVRVYEEWGGTGL